jgi:hypothetical protein
MPAKVELICDDCLCDFTEAIQHDTCPYCGGQLRPVVKIDPPASYQGGQAFTSGWVWLAAVALTIAGATVVWLLAGGPR